MGGAEHAESAARVLWWAERGGMQDVWVTKPDTQPRGDIQSGWRRVTLGAVISSVEGSNEQLPWHSVCDATEAPYYRWFAGARTNACFNAVDRHLLEQHGDWVAFTSVPESGASKSLNWRQLGMAVAAAARNLSYNHQMPPRSRALFHMPSGIDQMVWLLACQRVGIVYTATSLDTPDGALCRRVADFQPHAIVVCDSASMHAGNWIDAAARIRSLLLGLNYLAVRNDCFAAPVDSNAPCCLLLDVPQTAVAAVERLEDLAVAAHMWTLCAAVPVASDLKHWRAKGHCALTCRILLR